MFSRLTSEQKAYLAGIMLGGITCGIAVSLMYEDAKQKDRIADLEAEVSTLRLDKKILEKKINDISKDDDESEESEE